MNERSLRDLFHLVKQVVPEQQETVTVSPDTPVLDALERMAELSLSQIPVVHGREVLGVFSYRSFAEGVRRLPSQERDPLSVPVEEFIEDLRFATVTDELTALIHELDLKDAVLVGSQSKLQGIITTIDALRYFHRVASPYFLLREIELAIRELLRSAATPDQLQVCIEIVLRKLCEETGRAMPTSLRELTFADYVTLLRNKKFWPQFKTTFGGTANTVFAKLKRLPDLRNDVFHFRRELTVEDYEHLRETRDWLLKRIRIVESVTEGTT